MADQLNDIWSAGQAMLSSTGLGHDNLAILPTSAHTVWIQVHANTITPVIVPSKSTKPRPQQPAGAPLSAGRAMRPEPVFRQELHRALEETHRQQMAQRTLGTHAPVDWREVEHAYEVQSRAWSTALIMMGLALLWWLVDRRRSLRD